MVAASQVVVLFFFVAVVGSERHVSLVLGLVFILFLDSIFCSVLGPKKLT